MTRRASKEQGKCRDLFREQVSFPIPARTSDLPFTSDTYLSLTSAFPFASRPRKPLPNTSSVLLGRLEPGLLAHQELV